MSTANHNGRKDSRTVNTSTIEDQNEIKALASRLKKKNYFMSKLGNDMKIKIVKKLMSATVVNNSASG